MVRRGCISSARKPSFYFVTERLQFPGRRVHSLPLSESREIIRGIVREVVLNRKAGTVQVEFDDVAIEEFLKRNTPVKNVSPAPKSK